MSSLRLNPYFVCFSTFNIMIFFSFIVIQPRIIEIIMLSG